jgi:hypothetical protein
MKTTPLTLSLAQTIVSNGGAYVSLTQGGRVIGLYRLVWVESDTQVWLHDKYDGDTFLVDISSVLVDSDSPKLK